MNKNLARRFRRGFFVYSAMLPILFGTSFANQAMAQSIKTASAGSGMGSYICTPAGFGQKSKCYRR
ncbi:hypothetical protein [Sulfitobacter dubius]|uniref:hypothetical protein n=1 Tax=Sulfitobacter dubius TaxID=218673 RepID=UPI0022AF6823|nr:hypothetical protein [Sulfitobacter dubius]MCZ4368801.1 hypothetical protein [Sulfitobacter dubius]